MINRTRGFLVEVDGCLYHGVPVRARKSGHAPGGGRGPPNSIHREPWRTPRRRRTRGTRVWHRRPDSRPPRRTHRAGRPPNRDGKRGRLPPLPVKAIGTHSNVPKLAPASTHRQKRTWSGPWPSPVIDSHLSTGSGWRNSPAHDRRAPRRTHPATDDRSPMGYDTESGLTLSSCWVVALGRTGQVAG